MSLMQLLTASKSVLNIKDEPSRYRMSQRRLLPKFGPVQKTETETRVIAPQTGSREKKKDLIVKDTTENAGKRERFMARWLKLANPFARRTETGECQGSTTKLCARIAGWRCRVDPALAAAAKCWPADQ